MKERLYETPCGTIYYWKGGTAAGRRALVLLPGLTADHRLFESQIEALEPDYELLSWDAPGHAASRPFELNFSLMDKAVWLHDILKREGVCRPVLIGQSMGGYVSQCFIQSFPGEAAGFISIDSAPLKRSYVTAAELWLLKRMEPVYRVYPWKRLEADGAKGCSETAYGRTLMKSFMGTYSKDEYCRLAAHGYRMLAEAYEADLPYEIDCPALLICGEKDKAGSTKRYNRKWAEKEGLPICWIPGAGHNSNTDRPEEINSLIRKFAEGLEEGER